MSLMYRVFRDIGSEIVTLDEAKEFLFLGEKIQVNGPADNMLSLVNRNFPGTEYSRTFPKRLPNGELFVFLSKLPLEEIIINYSPKEEKENVMGR